MLEEARVSQKTCLKLFEIIMANLPVGNGRRQAERMSRPQQHFLEMHAKLRSFAHLGPLS